MTKYLSLCLVVVFACKQLAYGDIIIQGYTDATNNRFTNSPSFIAASFDLSGVGQTADAAWGTLISPNVVVSSTHFPATGTISFYPNNDPTSIPVSRQVTTTTLQVGNSDVWLSKLDNPVDSTITFYPFATTILTGPSNAANSMNDPLLLGSAGIYAGLNAYVVGRSPATNDNTRDQAVGRSVISSFAEDYPISGLTDALIFPVDNSHPFGATLVAGDSSAPFFVEINNQLVLLGVNSFNDDDNNMVVTAGAAAYLGNHAPTIQNFINMHAVPEPSSLLCSGLMLLGIAIRVRYRKPFEQICS
jgi:hypothetical protein